MLKVTKTIVINHEPTQLSRLTKPVTGMQVPCRCHDWCQGIAGEFTVRGMQVPRRYPDPCQGIVGELSVRGIQVP